MDVLPLKESVSEQSKKAHKVLFFANKEIDLDKKPINADDTFRIPVKTNSSES